MSEMGPSQRMPAHEIESLWNASRATNELLRLEIRRLRAELDAERVLTAKLKKHNAALRRRHANPVDALIESVQKVDALHK